MTLMLKDDEKIVERYKEYHRHAWPDVVGCLREVGVVNMRIYLLGRRMFMYMEASDGFDPHRDFPKLNDVPIYREWDELMRTLQQRAPEARPGDWWAPMEEVFDLSSQ